MSVQWNHSTKAKDAHEKFIGVRLPSHTWSPRDDGDPDGMLKPRPPGCSPSSGPAHITRAPESFHSTERAAKPRKPELLMSPGILG